METKIEKIDESVKSAHKRLDKLEVRQDDLEKLATSVALLAQKQEAIKTDVDEIKTDVKALSAKGGKLWEGLVEKALWLVVGGALTYFLSRLIE